MTGHLPIPDLISQLNTASDTFIHYCSTLTDEQFFHQPEGKWSPAQQVKHLITATNTSRLAFSLPKWIVRMVAGKPNRPSRTYDELVVKYKSKLQQGGRASGRFVPKPIPVSYGKERLLTQFSVSLQRFANVLQRNWKDPGLDQYVAPHPLLGKITLRELYYFNIYHTYHHLESIRSMTAA
jgi:DinB superfamily